MKGIQRIIATILAVFIGVLCYVQTVPVTASETELTTLDDTDIVDDMQNIKIRNYLYNSFGSPEVILALESCFSYRKNISGYYGFYIYLYNPNGNEIDTTKDIVANMAVKYGEDGKPSDYANVKLKCLGSATGYKLKSGAEATDGEISLDMLDETEEPLFWKFKVIQSQSLLTLEQEYMEKHEKRRYDIAGIQFCYKNGDQSSGMKNYNDVIKYAKDYSVSTTYYFTGYAKGCGADYNAENTLEGTQEVLETISLEVTATQYRPGDSNGKDDYTRDSLHSVYFSVPNDFITDYGGLWGIKAQWLDAVLKPALVTGNKDVYKALTEYLGKDISEIDDFDYGYLGVMSSVQTAVGPYSVIKSKYTYNMPSSWSGFSLSSEKILSALYLMFYSGDGYGKVETADSYVVSSEELQEKVFALTEEYGGELVLDRYSKCIFESVADEYTVVNLNNDDDSFSLASGKVSKDLFQKAFGFSTWTESMDVFNDLKVVQSVTYEDLVGKENFEVAEEFCVRESDVDDLRDAVKKAAVNDKTVYLFRYQVTDYESIEATLYEKSTAFGLTEYGRVDTNAYFFQETVNLDFEIIDLKFKKEDEVTIIPVVMSPIDIFPAADPPVKTTGGCGSYSADWKNLLKILLIVLLVFVVILIVRGVLMVSLQGASNLITLSVYDKRKERRNKRKNKKRR